MKILNKWREVILVLGCCVWTSQLKAQASGHVLWTSLLQKYVDADGQVNYDSWQKNPKQLNQYLAWLSAQNMSQISPSSERLAYWINLYNAYTISLILQHYPIQSIRSISAESVKNPWKINFIPLSDGRLLSLDALENLIIRKNFSEPRIHFALVCAAKSCPPLRREAYVSEKLETQLQEQGRIFINDPGKNQFHQGLARISPVFDWFKDDFGSSKEERINYLNRYAREHISIDVQLEYMSYDWQLNEQKK